MPTRQENADASWRPTVKEPPVYPNRNFANEVEFYADWNITDHIYFSAIAGYVAWGRTIDNGPTSPT